MASFRTATSEGKGRRVVRERQKRGNIRRGGGGECWERKEEKN